MEVREGRVGAAGEGVRRAMSPSKDRRLPRDDQPQETGGGPAHASSGRTGAKGGSAEARAGRARWKTDLDRSYLGGVLEVLKDSRGFEFPFGNIWGFRLFIRRIGVGRASFYSSGGW